MRTGSPSPRSSSASMFATARSPGVAEPCSIADQRSMRWRSSRSLSSREGLVPVAVTAENLCGDGLGCRRRLLEDERTIRGVHADAVARPPLALEQRQRELVDQLLLDHALERARAEGRVVAQVADQRLRVVGQLDLDAALGDSLGDLAQLQLDDRLDLLARARGERDDLGKAAKDLRLDERVLAL